MKNNGVNTPPGTPPMPTRRSTKNRRIGRDAWLLERAELRRIARNQRAMIAPAPKAVSK